MQLPIMLLLSDCHQACKPQCWDYCHFHEFECESLSYESESTKTEDHESEFKKFENLTGK